MVTFTKTNSYLSTLNQRLSTDEFVRERPAIAGDAGSLPPQLRDRGGKRTEAAEGVGCGCPCTSFLNGRLLGAPAAKHVRADGLARQRAGHR